MIKPAVFLILLLSLFPLFPVKIFSQDTEKISPYIQLQYFKNTDDQRILKTTLTYSKNRMELPLPGMEISFSLAGDETELIASVITDMKGVASLELSSSMNIPADKNLMWSFVSEFKGNDTIEAGTSEITFKDVILDMTLSEVDSIKTLSVKAFEQVNGKEIPVANEIILIYVPRMFSLLPVGELTLDENGTASIEFPADLPGDKDGKLTVIARFEENMIYGNVEKRETLNWGLPTDYSVPVTHRALWTKTAPKWMIYTLSILLAGVWGHYLFAIISLIRIRNNAKKLKKKNDYRI